MAKPGAVAPLAVTMGEPAGIGTEVVLKAYAAVRSGAAGPCLPFFLIDDPARVAAVARALPIDVPCTSIEAPRNAAEAFATGLPILPLSGVDFEALTNITPGQPDVAAAKAVITSIEQAVFLTLEGEASGVTTLPIQKSILQEAGFSFPGHTEFLGALTARTTMPQGRTRGPVMMLAAGSFRTVPVTIHLPLREVPAALTADLIVEVATVTAQALASDFGIASPRIAIAGLNPHAGEDGRMGTEERTIIIPAIEALRSKGIAAAGPFPADTMFHEDARTHYDAALAMYHDQGLVPIKTAAFHEAVNVTIGLPIIRTSPDHGTGLPIAGKGAARPDSTIAALVMASHMAAQRSAARRSA
ncbi:MAG: 4-hydroxythreonine-4-phosphate dehydrogenase PdxA [Pseudomonadota bacterium]